MEMDHCHIDNLREEILGLIFEYCHDQGQGQYQQRITPLLNYRLTSKTWKLTIENSTQIMRNLIFNLYDWPAFLQSTLLTKVKSIVINQPLNGNKIEDWFKICNEIGNSIQIVKFDFSTVDTNNLENIQQCIQMIQALMKSVTGLKELHIIGADMFQLINTNTLPVLQLPIHNNMEILVVSLSEPIVLKKIISSFPRLRKLVIIRADKEESLLHRNSEDKMSLQNALRDYINCQPPRGYLQEIVLNEPEAYSYMGDGLITFILYCAKHGIKVTRTINNGKDEIRFDLNKLFTYNLQSRAMTEEEEVINYDTCQYLQLVTLNIHGDLPIPTNMVQYCKKIQDLKIRFYRPAKLEELLFLPKLQQKLTSLKLIGQLGVYCGIEAFDGLELGRNIDDDVEEYLENVIFPIQSLKSRFKETTFSTLENLDIKGDLFGLQQFAGEIYSAFYIYFPNLQSISLVNLTIVSDKIFVHLAKLECLRHIYINGGQSRGMRSFVDSMFSCLCKSVTQRKDNNNMEIVPAIAAFKCLKSLRVENCQNLTDTIITNGIIFNQTLTEFSIRGLGQVTFTGGVCALRNVNFKYDQPTIPGSYDFKRKILF